MEGASNFHKKFCYDHSFRCWHRSIYLMAKTEIFRDSIEISIEFLKSIIAARVLKQISNLSAIHLICIVLESITN